MLIFSSFKFLERAKEHTQEDIVMLTYLCFVKSHVINDHSKGNPHGASAATLALPLALSLPLEYIVMLGNGSGTDFQASPRHHRPTLAAEANPRCG